MTTTQKIRRAGTARIVINGKAVELPVLRGTHGPDVIDITRLYADGGVFTLDPGYTVTGSCESRITFIDGEEGILLHRGYPIEQLAEQSTFLELGYLLLNGQLPLRTELTEFCNRVTQHTMLHTQMDRFFDGFRRDSHPMAMLTGTAGALSAFYPDVMGSSSADERYLAYIRLIAKMPTLVARIYKYTQGQPFVDPLNELSYSENFLRMCFSIPAEKYRVSPVLARAMDKIFILHADHEQNASTSTVRLSGSSGAHPYAAVAAGVASLWGPSHGGANEACLNMLRAIGDTSRIPEYIARSKDKNDGFRLMGFGHRVYKNYDPRATVMQKTAHEVLDALGIDTPILRVARELERIALEDDYFQSKKLYPNVDFYSGILLDAIGFPTEMFTVLFALARTAGWVSQLNEMIIDPAQRIGRPRQVYTGPARRDFVPVDSR